MKWYPRYPADYDIKTLGLTLAEHGAYCRLIDAYMVHERPLPSADEELAALLRCSLEAWLEVAPKVRRYFKTEPDGLLHQDRCDEELADQGRLASVSRENGKLGGRPKGLGSKKKSGAKPRSNPDKTQTKPQDTTLQDITNPPAEGVPAPSKHGTRLPADWQPSEADIAYAASKGLDPDAIAERFKNFWLGKAGKNGVKLDWAATWRNWCLDDAENGRNFAKAAPATATTTESDEAIRWRKRVEGWKASGLWYGWGPKPDEWDTQVPDAILTEHGLIRPLKPDMVRHVGGVEMLEEPRRRVTPSTVTLPLDPLEIPPP